MTNSGSRAIYRLLPVRFTLMFRRLLLQHLYRVRGKIFGPPHKVGLASHIRNGNFGEVCRRQGEVLARDPDALSCKLR
jgi:hypothetical protein